MRISGPRLQTARRFVTVWLVVGGLSLALAPPTAAQIQTHHDTVPDFAANPTSTAQQNGAWSAPATWGGTLPRAGDIVRIPPGVTVVYDVASNVDLAVVGIEGELVFAHAIPTRLVAGTIMVKPGGSLQVGTAAQPVTALAEIIIADRPPADPTTQYGTGLLVWGRIEIHGLPVTPWRRLARAPQAGQTALTLYADADGWRAGDQVVIPDSRHVPLDHPTRYDKYVKPQTEVRTISAATPGFVTLTTPLTFTHPDARNVVDEAALDRPVHRWDGEPLTPHVGHLTRTVVIRSANPAGTRGHVWITGHSEVAIRYAQFRDLGRTTTATLGSSNIVGRYVLHLHHVWGHPRPWPSGLSATAIRELLETTGWQFVVEGNALVGTGTPHKWAITLHDSHFGLVRGNVVYNIAGSGIQTEQGHESYNLIADNLIVRVPGLGERKVDNSTTSDIGKDGSGLWLRGPHNWVEGNVAADTRFAAFYLSQYFIKEQRVPLYPGADPAQSDEGRSTRLRPILSWRNNEAYGPVQHGLWGSWISGCCNAGLWPDNRVEQTTIWHAWASAIKWYHNGRTTFDGILIRGDSRVTRGASFEASRPLEAIGIRLTAGGYENVDQVYRNLDIEGMVQGVYAPRTTYEYGAEPPLLIEQARLKNYINVRVPRADGSRASTLLRGMVFETFTRPAHPLSGVPLNIFMHYNAESGSADASATRVLWDVGGVVRGVYFKEAGFSCTTQVPGVFGYVCP